MSVKGTTAIIQISWHLTPLYIIHYVFVRLSMTVSHHYDRQDDVIQNGGRNLSKSRYLVYLLTWCNWVIPLRRRAGISTFVCRRLARVLLRLLRAGHSRADHSTNRPPVMKENMLLKISSVANIVSAPLLAQILGINSRRLWFRNHTQIRNLYYHTTWM